MLRHSYASATQFFLVSGIVETRITLMNYGLLAVPDGFTRYLTRTVNPLVKTQTQKPGSKFHLNHSSSFSVKSNIHTLHLKS